MNATPIVVRCVEALCHKGCRQVWYDIEAIEQGAALPETQGLSAAEQAAVLSELKAVMAVYGDRCTRD